MSIIMLASRPTNAEAAARSEAEQFDVTLGELLDHIAVELAHEYIRLMEASAEARSNDDLTDPGEHL